MLFVSDNPFSMWYFNESEIDNYSFQEFKKQSKKLNQVKSFLTNLKKIGLELEFV